MPLHIFLGVMKCSCILLCELKSFKFKFDFNSNCFVIYKTILEKKNVFLFEFGFRAESSARPSRPPRAHAACMAQPTSTAAQWFTGAHPRSEAESDPLSESDPIAPNPTRYEANPTRTHYHTR
jgi:hypothetical protein